MTERNLRNGWSDWKTRRRFIVLVTLFHVVAWMMDANRYVNRLEWELLKVADLLRTDIPIKATDYEFIQGGGFAIGLLCAIVTTVYLAITAVHRESFKENWHVTLRRIPNYRGKYLRAKLLTVLFPVAIYGVYGILQWCFQRSMYRTLVPEALRAGSVWRFPFAEEVLLPMVNLALFALSVLLLCFVLRNVKRDILGGIVAIGGVGMMVVCKHVLNFSESLQRMIAVSCVICVEVLFLVRYVYRKL